MSQDVKLSAKKRDTTGKKAAAALRADGRVPAIVQEHGKDTVQITVDNIEMLKAFSGAGKSQPLDLTVEGSKQLALIKEIEFVPLKSEVQHVVFQALNQNEAVDAEIPVHVVGEIPAEENRLVLLHTLETVIVRALPKDLPEALEVSGASLAEIDDRLSIRDIMLPEGVELVEMLMNADDDEKQEEFLSQPIVLVKDPAVLEVDEGVELEEGESEGDAVESEHGEDTDQTSQNDEIRPGGKKEFEDKEQGHNPEKQ